METTVEILSNLEKLIVDVNKDNSSNNKMETLAKYPQCKTILNYIYNEFKMYGVTSDNILKMADIEPILTDYSLIDLLDKLYTKDLTGHTAIAHIKGFLEDYPEYSELILRIIDKDIMIGMGISNINKVFPNLIPTFDVALANSYADVSGKIDLEEYYGSRKLDGLRCIAIKKGDNVQFYSRKGKEFLTLDVVKEQIIKHCHFENVVFDGELCIVDTNGKEDFTSIMKVYKKKDFTIPNPKYKIFDMLSIEEFTSKTSTRIFSDRYRKLRALIPSNNKVLEVLEQVPMDDKAFTMMQEKANTNGWEGLILRKDTIYKGKRSNDILKVKKFFDAEYIVTATEYGPFQVVEDGVRKEIETLTAVHISHKGFDVKVGSGFSIDQRKEFYNNPEKILGKTINVQYFEETTNEKDNGISLRFPTLKFIYAEGREV